MGILLILEQDQDVLQLLLLQIFRVQIVTGIDISEDALKIARENALLNNVNVSFIKEDIFRF